MGRYRVYRQIGSGGMGIVCEAGQVLPSGEERAVALKWIHPELGQDAASVRRFDQEADLHTRVSSHPNLVTVYEVDHDQQGRQFMALEYVDGATLDALAACHAPLAHHVVRSILDECLDALGYMHAHGVVHRDLSLKNIMVSVEGRVKLLDLRLARLMTGEVSNPGFMGTAAYASPEVLDNVGAELGASADLYSLAAIGYRLLTGNAPFGEGAWTEVRERMEAWNIEPLADDVPEDLRELITGLLRREVHERSCASADECRRVLDRHKQPLATDQELAMLAFQACERAPAEEPANIDIIERSAIIEMRGPTRQPEPMATEPPQPAAQPRVKRASRYRWPLAAGVLAVLAVPLGALVVASLRRVSPEPSVTAHVEAPARPASDSVIPPEPAPGPSPSAPAPDPSARDQQPAQQARPLPGRKARAHAGEAAIETASVDVAW